MKRSKVGTNDFEIDLWAVAYELYRKLWLVVLCALVFASASYVVSEFVMEKEYTSTTKVFIIYKGQGSSQLTQNDLITGGLLVSDYEEVIKSRYVMDRVISELGLESSSDALSSSVSVTAQEGNRVIYIYVTAKDPYIARDIANKVTEVAGERMIEIMNIDAVNVIDEATLSLNPASPSIKTNVMNGAIIGAVLACLYVVVRYLLDDTIMIPDDVNMHLNLSVLAVIPNDDVPKKQTKHRRRKS